MCKSAIVSGMRLGLIWLLLTWALLARATILWSDLGSTLVHETGDGSDILGGAVKEDDSSTNTLYFKFQIDPLSDASTEEYFAAFELYEGDKERFGVGNALKAWAYSAFKADVTGESREGSDYIDLRSSRPEPSSSGSLINYENPHRGIECTIVFKVQYVAGDDDLVTVWLNPDLGPGASEAAQPESLITQFKANCSFNEIHLRHGGGGGGWIFSDMAIATSFNDFVAAANNESSNANFDLSRGKLPFTFRSWQREQGLPQDFIRAIAQTRDGYLWIGTDDGVARFDGVKFVSFGLPEGLHSGAVRTLFGDSNGTLWIGSVGGGLIRRQNDRFQTFTMKDGLPSDSITALAEDDKGRLWVGTDAGLVIWQNGHLSALNTDEFKKRVITTLFRDGQGNMWIGASGLGVFEFRQNQFHQLTDLATEALLQDVHSLLVDKRGRIWIGAGDDFVLCRDGAQWRPYRIPRHMARSYVNALAEESDGTVWAASASEGLFQFKDDKLITFNASSGLTDNSVESLLVDRQGNLWVGTDDGLNLLRQKNLFVFGQSEGLGYGAVEGLAEVAPGVIWASKPGDGLYRWDGRGFSRLLLADLAINGTQINSLLVARDGSCWVAGPHGLLHFKNSAANKAELFTLPGLNIISLAEDKNDSIWVGTRDGQLWRLQNKNWTQQTNFAQTHAITAIITSPDGVVWAGTEGSGIYQFKNGNCTHFNTQDGLLSDLIRTLYLDAQGTLWIGTAGGGLSRFSNDKIITFTTREGLSDNTVSQIFEDDAGRLWLGSNRGIACVEKSELNRLAEGKITTIYPQVYGRSEGMLSEECTGGFCPAGLKTKSGLLWFSTLKGIVVVDPQLQRAKSSAPEVLLEDALVDGVVATNFETTDLSIVPGDEKSKSGAEIETLNLSPGKHRIELRYTGLNFDAPEQIRFRYRLEGLDSDWVEAGPRRSAFYNYVPPGKYRFQVIACNSDGVWNEAGQTLALNVPPYFWQTKWFIAGMALAILGLVGGAVRISEKRKHQRRLRQLEQERALERERARIAQDLHDEMGAKLCRISFLSEHARRNHDTPQELQRQITSISDTSREVLYSLDEIVWAVNPQNDALEHVASYIGHYAQEYFQETGVECELDIPAHLPAYPLSSQLRHHLFLAVHEAFTNILKHSGATRCRISIACNSVTLEIIVSDNGKGFEPPPMRPDSNGSTAVSGNGLRNMHQRLVNIGGYCLIKSEPKTGTTIRFVLPLQQILERKATR
ncbi:MAG TPA: two-component regulator propeller domain-containing protein [Verrucomicrobiae bacterium]|nr:two-component regulator propeller domain-containing protein [Verrucomicrobiae bacterium]